MSLTYIAQQLNVYTGITFLVIGVIGNGMNIFIFSSIRSYRRTPSTFYFLVVSIHNIIYIILNLTVRIVNAYYSLDLTRNSLVWCRMHSFFIGYLGLTSFTCSSLTTIDQFFATSKHAYLRRCSNIKWAHRFVIIAMIVWALHGIPLLIFFNIPPVASRCRNVNPIYATYLSMYVLLFQSGIPSIIMIIFGYLSYNNIRRTIVLLEQRADRQLVRMILIQLVLVVVSMVPFGTYTIYGLITAKLPKDVNQLTREFFAVTVLTLVSYFYYVVCFINLSLDRYILIIYFQGNFYMFLIISSRFRRTVKDRLLCWRQRRNLIIPFQQPTF